MPKYLIFFVILIVLQVACLTNSNEQATTTPFTNSVIPTIEPTFSIIITPSPNEIVASTLSVTELPPLPTESIQSIPLTLTPTITATLIASNLVEQRCISSNSTFNANIEQLAGIIFSGIWRNRIEEAVIGREGLLHPSQFISNPYSEFLTPLISPGGEWASDVEWVNMEGIAEMTVINLHTGQEIRKSFAPVLIPFGSVSWLNETTLYAFLANSEGEMPYTEGEIYHLFIWEPMSNEEKIITILLDGVIPPAFSYATPVIDPQQQYIVYLCSSCIAGKEGYAIKDIETSKIVWTIPLNPQPMIVFRSTPIWSLNGQYVALAVGSTLNEIVIYSRQGQEIDRIIFPESRGLTYFGGNWSPDNKYFAMKIAPNSGEDRRPRLVYYSLENKVVTDLCIFPSNTEIWSPDSTRFIFATSEEQQPAQYLFMVNVITGEVNQFYDEVGYIPISWTELQDSP